MTSLNRNQMIYPPQRAVEHAATVPGLRPRRLFALLWPLRQVEISAEVYDEQPYELIERFVVLAILDCGYTRVPDLARFLGVPDSLVHRCLSLLSMIGHVQFDGGSACLTELGERSAREQIRYVLKESRQDLLFEAFTVTPLPRRYYDKRVHVLESPDADENRRPDRTKFTPLFPNVRFSSEVVHLLANHPDRATYNLPELSRNLSVLRTWDAFLPIYLIETADDELLAYSAAGSPRDTFLESLCRKTPQIHTMIANESRGDPGQIWTDWVANSGNGPGTLRQLTNGIWRITFRAAAFGPHASMPLNQVGSFRFRQAHFAQLWCNDEKVRHRSLLDRSLRMLRLADVATKADLLAHTASLSELLEIPTLSLSDLHDYAEQEGTRESVARLKALD